MCSQLSPHHSAVLKKSSEQESPNHSASARLSRKIFSTLQPSLLLSATLSHSQQTAEGLERAHVHWPGKGGKSQGKTWHCVLVPPTADTSETVSALAEAQITPRQASSWEHQEEMGTLMTGIYMTL